MKQLYIDESGDSGVKKNNGSSSHFVIAGVLFEDIIDALEAELSIKRLRRRLHWADNREFKFNKLKKSIVSDLLREVSAAKFEVYAISIDKESLDTNIGSEIGYWSLVGKLISQVPIDSETRIFLDSIGGKKAQRKLETDLRRELRKSGKQFKDLTFCDSKEYDLIQLADLIAGSINRSYQIGKTDSQEYISIIRHRIKKEANPISDEKATIR
jgi:hypothetical protein